MSRALSLLALFALACSTPAPAPPPVEPPPVEAPAPKPAQTLANLQAAFEGESNANAKYTAFAVKADEEGYAPVASLFRAAAAAELLHANNHAVVIRAMGAEPAAVIAEHEVKTTAENLQAAIDGETHEMTEMYPGFIEIAKAEDNMEALRTFTFALKAEEGHAALYTAILADLENQKGEGKTYGICPLCGLTEEVGPEHPCMVCGTPRDQFQLIQ